jgi:hypothetical protein
MRVRAPIVMSLPAMRTTQEHKFFDSADWAMNKEAAAKGGADGAPAPPPTEQLKPKLEPTPLPARRISHLDPSDS